nr:hypothetical protein CFP56_70394 [Quercus suber]
MEDPPQRYPRWRATTRSIWLGSRPSGSTDSDLIAWVVASLPPASACHEAADHRRSESREAGPRASRVAIGVVQESMDRMGTRSDHSVSCSPPGFGGASPLMDGKMSVYALCRDLGGSHSENTRRHRDRAAAIDADGYPDKTMMRLSRRKTMATKAGEVTSDEYWMPFSAGGDH